MGVTWTPTRNISITPSVARTASLHHRCPTHLDFNLQPPPPPPPTTTPPVVVVAVLVEQTHARTIFIFKMFNLFSVFFPPVSNLELSHTHTHTHARMHTQTEAFILRNKRNDT